MKKLTFLMAILFASAMVFGQNTKTLNQSGGTTNTDYSVQVGDGNLIYIKQALPGISGTNTAGVSAADRILQSGDDNIARLNQSISTEHADNANLAKIKQIGNLNKLVGATSSGYLDSDNSNAVQTLSGGSYANDLNVLQHGGNRNAIGLYQHAKWNNDFGTSGADIEQDGYRNQLVVYQSTSAASSKASTTSLQSGDDNLARIKQTAGGGDQNLTLRQVGDDNKVVGANMYGTILTGGVAIQNTGLAWGSSANTLEVVQSGDGNEIGLNQETYEYKESVDNEAYITQTGGAAKVGAYQYSADGTAAGDNYLYVSQLGGADVATIIQTSAGSNSSTTIQ